MTIDFDSIEMSILPNFKGGEKEYHAKMFFDGKNRIMQGLLQPGASIGLHTHETNSETIFIVEGKGTVIDDGVSSEVHSGQCTYCPKGHSHSLINTGTTDLKFYAVVPEQ